MEAGLRPLSRGYTREKAVESDIRRMQALPPGEFWKSAEVADYRAPESARLESLVYWVRQFESEGRIDDAWRVMELLMRRIAVTVGRYLAQVYGLSADQREELRDELATLLYTEWLSLDPAHEFWEARFAVCLKRKLIDVVSRHRRVTSNEVVLTATNEDDHTNVLETIPDEASMSPETAALLMSALDSLDEPQRTAFYLRYHEQWQEEAIAQHLGVTSRSIRNYLRRAEQSLAEWRDTET
jgi:RNA polymerase sigma factor (sigma-70 family)